MKKYTYIQSASISQISGIAKGEGTEFGRTPVSQRIEQLALIKDHWMYSQGANLCSRNQKRCQNPKGFQSATAVIIKAQLETYSPLLIRSNMQSGEIFGPTRVLTISTSTRCRRVCQVAVANALHEMVGILSACLSRRRIEERSLARCTANRLF